MWLISQRPRPAEPSRLAARARTPRDAKAQPRADLIRRHAPFVELDWLDCERSGPAGLVAECVLECGHGVLLTEEEVDRFRVAELYERTGAHA